MLSDIIEPRVEEIFAVVRKRIEDTGLLEQLSAGAVLTGGAVLLEGMSEFAEEILGMPVRIGYPVGIQGITQLVQGPQFATGVGLVKFGAQALADARARRVRPAGGDESACGTPPKVEPRTPEVAQQKAKFWQWLEQHSRSFEAIVCRTGVR